MTSMGSILDLEMEKVQLQLCLPLFELTGLFLTVSMPALIQVPPGSPEHWHNDTFQSGSRTVNTRARRKASAFLIKSNQAAS